MDRLIIKKTNGKYDQTSCFYEKDEKECDVYPRGTVLIDLDNNKTKIISRRADSFELCGVNFDVWNGIPVPSDKVLKEKVLRVLTQVEKYYLIQWGFDCKTVVYTWDSNVKLVANPFEKTVTLGGMDVSALDKFSVKALANRVITMYFHEPGDDLLGPVKVLIERSGNGLSFITVRIKTMGRNLPEGSLFTYFDTKCRIKSENLKRDRIQRCIDDVFTIMTSEGKKKVPLKPAVLDFRGVEQAFKVPDEEFREGEFLIPGEPVRIKDKIILAIKPGEWAMKKRNGNVVRFNGRVYYEEKGEFGAEKTFRSATDTLYFWPVFSTGQNAILARRIGDKVRAYGIATPEGVYAIEAPAKRLERDTPVSIFERDVEVLGTFVPFPVQIPFESGTLIIEGNKKFVIMDGMKLQLEVMSTPKKLFEKHGIKEEEYRIVATYGLT